MKFVFLGLTITSSWGNGHATTYRALARHLAVRHHEVVFLERDVPWYASHRDLAAPPYARTILYNSLDELRDVHASLVSEADLAIVGSYVPDGRDVGEWVLGVTRGGAAFYDIDTPITLEAVARGACAYLEASQIARYALYLSFTGGPTLSRLEREWGSPAARALYCSVDPELHYPEPGELRWDLGYLGTHSADRQPALERLLFEPARAWPEGRFHVAGAQYPDDVVWPPNVAHTRHLPPSEHRRFYVGQRWTLNVTRRAMIEAGWSPSVRLFEAAACGTPIVSDRWRGLEEVLVPGREIAVADTAAEALRWIRSTTEKERRAIADAARTKILAEHTAMHRAEALERFTREVHERRARRTRRFREVNA